MPPPNQYFLQSAKVKGHGHWKVHKECVQYAKGTSWAKVTCTSYSIQPIEIYSPVQPLYLQPGVVPIYLTTLFRYHHIKMGAEESWCHYTALYPKDFQHCIFPQLHDPFKKGSDYHPQFSKQSA